MTVKRLWVLCLVLLTVGSFLADNDGRADEPKPLRFPAFQDEPGKVEKIAPPKDAAPSTTEAPHVLTRDATASPVDEQRS